MRKIPYEDREPPDHEPDRVTMTLSMDPVQWRKLIGRHSNDAGSYLHQLALSYLERRKAAAGWQSTEVRALTGRLVGELTPDFSEEGPDRSVDDSTIGERFTEVTISLSPAMRRDIEAAVEESREPSVERFLLHARQAQESFDDARGRRLRTRRVDRRDRDTGEP